MADNRRKVLMVVTNVDRLPGTNIPTGFFLRELTHPYYEVHEAGFEIDLASIQGGSVPIDPHSDPRQPDSEVQDDIISMGFLNSPQHAERLNHTLRLSEVDVIAYDAIFFSGGSGAIFDFPTDQTVARVVSRAWSAGKIVGGMCHGSGALLNATDSDGSSIVKGFEVTGQSTAEEDEIHDHIPEFKPPLYLEDEFPKRGAIYRQAGLHAPFAITTAGGRLITGQNNRSGSLVGRQLVSALTAQR